MDPVMDAAAKLKAWACGINQPGRYGLDRKKRLADAQRGILHGMGGV